MESALWEPAGREWLQRVTEKLFADWRNTKQGKKWNAKRSPYAMGFSLPCWVHNAVDALAKGDEERFKAIKLTEGMYINF